MHTCEHVISYCSGFEIRCTNRASHVLVDPKSVTFYNGRFISTLFVCKSHINIFTKSKHPWLTMPVNEFLVYDVMNE